MKIESKKRAIDKIYKRRDRYEIPEWQRQPVWNRLRKQDLIDSILRGWKLPKLYFLKTSDNPEEYEVVDGQQRLNAIFEFFDNRLPLTEEAAKLFGGSFYKELPDPHTDAFDDYEIEFDLIEDATDDEVKMFFQRLQKGLPLTSSEKLNSIPSKLRDFVMEQTGHAFFKKIAASDKRYGHFDILAKTATVEIEGIGARLRFDDLRTVFENQSQFSSHSNVALRIERALEFVHKGFTDGQASLLRNRTVVQSLLTLVCRLMQNKNIAGKEKRVAEFFDNFLKELSRQVELGQKSTDFDYIHFQQTVNANVQSGAKIRQTILLRKLLEFDPAFVDIFDPTLVAESGIQTAVKDKTAAIGELVASLNEKYSATHGNDLFKATTKTTKALTKIGRPIKDYEGYKTFIDQLYFLFHEGVGDRLNTHRPQSFKDINVLRTDLRHDLDHGKPSKVRAKRKATGAVFKKYSGVPSPVGLAPEKFVLVQEKLLTAIKSDLETLAASM